jgi:hypothetical protein
MKITKYLIRFAFFITLTLQLCACEKMNSSNSKSSIKNPMAVYSVQGPNGLIYDIRGPANASDDEVISWLIDYLEPSRSVKHMPSMIDLTINGEPVPCLVNPNLGKNIYPNRISISCP